MAKKATSEATVRTIWRRTKRKHSAEEKIRIVLEGWRGDQTITELNRREGINQNLYRRWSKEFLEAEKARLIGDTKRQASSETAEALRNENEQLPGLNLPGQAAHSRWAAFVRAASATK